jgi:menaquinone-dependent protoporphyrinogen IX oxidase
MKALIVYASWFGHNRAIAHALAKELTRQGGAVICASVSRINKEDLAGIDLLVLGTYTHAGHANRRLRQLCESIPHRRLDRMEIAVFGTQQAEARERPRAGGIDELVALLEERGCEIALPPLRVGLRGRWGFLPWKGIGAEARHQIKAFAADLLEASMPAPLV